MIPLTFAPDIDTAWSVAPGTVTAMSGFAPLQNGAFGSIGTTNYFGSATLTGTDHYNAFMFRLQDASVVLLTGRAATIDRYDNAGSRTNVGSGYTSIGWSMAAWGDLIIATNAVDAVQASTAGGAFSALGGSPPTAALVAANQNFVMLGRYGTTYDGVYWSALQNPLSWTTDIKTQCGNYRLLDTPGPITNLVSYRGSFIAFKQNSMYVGTYQGPPYVWGWKPISSRVGCIGQASAVECDGKLYFFHTSGFYEYDGMSLRNIGVPVAQSFLAESAYIAETSNGVAATDTTTYTPVTPGFVHAVSDDVDGIVWWRGSYVHTSNAAGFTFLYGYNVRTGKWSRHFVATGTTAGASSIAATSTLVKANSADVRDFLTSDKYARFLMIWNDTGGTTMRSVRYPYASTDSAASTYTLGTIGNVPGQQYANRIYMRHLPGSSVLSSGEVTGSVAGFIDEAKSIAVGNATATWNASQFCLDFSQNAEFAVPTVTYGLGEKVSLGGVDINLQKVGTR